LDCYTKMVVGWAMSDNYKTPLISAAIGMAVRNHDIKDGAIFHSDRGRTIRPPSSARCFASMGSGNPSGVPGSAS
ncbi:MAG: hypothetical protein WA890_19385, partial [Micromonospora sp.]